jgi:hypothetical protein
MKRMFLLIIILFFNSFLLISEDFNLSGLWKFESLDFNNTIYFDFGNDGKVTLITDKEKSIFNYILNKETKTLSITENGEEIFDFKYIYKNNLLYFYVTDIRKTFFGINICQMFEELKNNNNFSKEISEKYYPVIEKVLIEIPVMKGSKE